MKYFFHMLILIFSWVAQVESSIAELPVAYQGRFRPLEAYARLWLEEIYHNPKLPVDIVWNLHFQGHEPWDDAPLFHVSQALKIALGLDLSQSYFSYTQLTGAIHASSHTDSKELSFLADALSQVSHMHAPIHETAGDSPRRQSLLQAGNTLKMLPSRYHNGEWYSLKALKINPIQNFTLYSDRQFESIHRAYLDLEKAFIANVDKKELDHLFAEFAAVMANSYQSIAGTTYQEAYGKSLKYPSLLRLKAETLYYQIPLLETTLILYAIGLICFAFFRRVEGIGFLVLAFCTHTLILTLRSYILHRPPVSNMFETVIYVPWIAMFAGFILHFIFKSASVLIASAFTACMLIGLLKVIGINPSLDNVQAVLDSQYWLIIHVLMVVGSYGLFCLAGLLGHYYLLGYILKGAENHALTTAARILSQTLYLGVALLIAGTLLGGVWAAQSWGRFWDWDPKESWAFISCCLYLIVIHAYTFHHIGHFGLALGAIIGLQIISFTWYGVNYILGSGLHSYGFGSGGEVYYYLFLAVESVFILWALYIHHKSLQTR